MPPMKPTVPDLRRHRRHHADQIAALMLGEDHRARSAVPPSMSMIANLVSGKSGRDLAEHIAKGKAGHHDRVGTRLRPDGAAPVRAGLRTASRVPCRCRRFRLVPRVGAVEGGLVEGLVELAAKVVDDRRVGQSVAPAVSASVAAAPRNVFIRVIGLSRLSFCRKALPAGVSGSVSCGSTVIRAERPGAVKSGICVTAAGAPPKFYRSIKISGRSLVRPVPMQDHAHRRPCPRASR